MGLVTITDIQDGTDADANDVNSRFATVVSEINGGLDSANLANNAVTQAKIAAASVSSDKLTLSKTQDANGWTVYDFGTFKQYRKKGTFQVTIPGYGWISGEGEVALPAGMSSLGTRFLDAATGSNDAAVTVNPYFTNAGTSIIFNVTNAYSLEVANKDVSYSLTITES